MAIKVYFFLFIMRHRESKHWMRAHVAQRLIMSVSEFQL